MRLLVGQYPRHVIHYIGEPLYNAHFGMLVSPRDRKRPQSDVWAADNFAFTDFNANRFKTMLQNYRDIPGCKFVAAPDVVGNASATLRRFARWHGLIEGYGYPVALVAQNGLENLPIPWGDIACLFIGGDDAYKLGLTVAHLVSEAKERGKWVHMGRVNTMQRLRYAQSIGCDSVDGSSYARFTKITLKHLPYLQYEQGRLIA